MDSLEAVPALERTRFVERRLDMHLVANLFGLVRQGFLPLGGGGGVAVLQELAAILLEVHAEGLVPIRLLRRLGDVHA